MPYKKPTINDAKRLMVFNCPCCWDFEAKTKKTILKHIDDCDGNYYQGCHPDDIIIGDNDDDTDEDHTTAGIILHDREIVIKNISNFIKTNELEGIANRTGKEIREYIKQKLNIINDKREINQYIYLIYKLFFDMTDEDDQMEEIEVFIPLKERVLNRL